MSIQLIIDNLNGHDSQGTIGKIKKKVGDNLEVGDVIFTMETGKGVKEYKSKCKGKLLELKIDEGDVVKKNQVIGSVDGVNEVKKTAYSFGLSTPKKEDLECDVLIIGGGPGGYVAGIRTSQLGLKTIIVEKDKLGGTCLNYGCIPTKALVQSISTLEHIKNGSHYGFNVADYNIDFKRVIERKDEVVDQLVTGIKGLMNNHDIKVINGEAIIGDNGFVIVKNKKVDATIKYNKMILAVGASPSILPIQGADLAEVLTSREMLELTEIPKSLTIIGGGIIGMEIGFIYNSLGSEVNVIEFFPQILSCVDKDVSDVVKQSAIEKGINIYEGAKATKIAKTLNDQMLTEIEIEGNSQVIASEKVLMAVGRTPNLKAVDIDKLGIKLNDRKNGIEVNDYLQTNVENIYAIGDITNKIQLAHVASHQGIVAAEHIAGLKHKMSYDLVPSAIFTLPEIGTVGLNEEDAKKQGLNITVTKFPFMACGKAIAMNEIEGFVKLIVDKDKQIIIGGAIVGAHSTDLIAIITQLISNKTTLDEACTIIYAHPTLGESIHEALMMADNKGIHFG